MTEWPTGALRRLGNMQANSQSRSATLDAVRGVAIGQVVVWHIVVPFLPPFLRRALSLSWSGVDLFFVLSGFLIGGILMDNVRSEAYFRAFYGRRAFRILPLYFACLTLFALYPFFMNWYFADWLRDPELARPFNGPNSWVAYVTFTQNVYWSIESHWGAGWVGPTWSLAVEEQFYLVLPAVIRFTRASRWPHIFLGCALVAPLLRSAVFALWGPYAAYMLMPCRCDSLFLGVFVAWCVRSPHVVEAFRQKRRLALSVIALLVGGLPLFTGYGDVDLLAKNITLGISWLAALYALILTFVVTNDQADRAALRYFPLVCTLGIGAYAIYLFHMPALFVTELMRRDAGPMTHLLAITLACGVAWASWVAIERPAINFAKTRFSYGFNSLKAITALGDAEDDAGYGDSSAASREA